MSELSEINTALRDIAEQLGGLRSDVATIKHRGSNMEDDVRKLQLAAAHSAGRASIISVISGTVAGIITAIVAVLVKHLFGPSGT